jgi:hypothetical protein
VSATGIFEMKEADKKIRELSERKEAALHMACETAAAPDRRERHCISFSSVERHWTRKGIAMVWRAICAASLRESELPCEVGMCDGFVCL